MEKDQTMLSGSAVRAPGPEPERPDTRENRHAGQLW